MNTHKDLFQFTRLPFGVSSAPSFFQRMMDNTLQGIRGVCAYYIDDVLYSGKIPEEYYLAKLEAVFADEKCYFMLPSVEYLG